MCRQGLPIARVAVLLLAAVYCSAQQIDYLQNDLAKGYGSAIASVCRPLDKSLDIMFVLDGSGSVSGNTFDTQMRLVNKVIEMVDVGPEKTQIAILQYSGYTRMEFGFKEYQNKTSLRKGISEIKHISGTTKTGKALERAYHAFSVEDGARMNHKDVAQPNTRFEVAVVVSDGHSHDDPVPAAERLRAAGVTVLALGIGNHINMDELEQIADRSELAFHNESLSLFVNTFRKLLIGEYCEYAKGARGAEILCQNDTIEVNILTTDPFYGHLYVPSYFNDADCVSTADDLEGSLEEQRSVTLRIPLGKCGVQKQFLFSPTGLLFETGVILKLHPDYNTPADKIFGIRCFYPDMRYHIPELTTTIGGRFETAPQLAFQLDPVSGSLTANQVFGDPLVASYSVPEMQMPCAYSIVKSDRSSCVLENTKVGDTIVHRWECDSELLGTTYGMLVHSCFISDGSGHEMKVLDHNGCSLDKSVMNVPEYPTPLVGLVPGRAIKFADNPTVKFRCSLRFCHIENGECAKYLPPNCGENVTDDNEVVRRKRQSQLDTLYNLDGMPKHMQDRLFNRRRQFLSAQAHQAVRARIRPQAPSGFTTAEPLKIATDYRGLPVLVTLQPLGVAGAPRTPPNVLQPAVNIVAETEPPTESTEASSTTTTTTNTPSTPATVSETSTSYPQTSPSTSNSPQTPELVIDFIEDSAEVLVDGVEGSGEYEEANLPLQPTATGTTPPPPAEATETAATTTEAPSDDAFLLQGLAKDILSHVDFMQVDLQSQTMTVQDIEDIREQGRSPVNWCPRNF